MPVGRAENFATLFVQMLVLAFVYFVAARICVLLAIPPGYASAMWPPAGIALAAVLMFGTRVWPGIFVGAGAAHMVTTLGMGDAVSIAFAVQVSGAIALGAVVQAWIGGSLIRKYVGFPSPLNDWGSIVKFFVIGGPIASVASAIVAVTVLWQANILSWEQFANNFVTWWVGDIIGVVVFAPVALIFIPQHDHVWHRRQWTVGMPLCLTFAIIATFYVYVSSKERDTAQQSFQSEARELANMIHKHLDGYLEVLHSMESLFATSQNLSRQDFEAFASRLTERHPGIHAITWNPRIPGTQRESFERKARRDGMPFFRIGEIDEHGHAMESSERKEYCPILFVEPYTGNEMAIGLDMMSLSARREAMIEAGNSGTPVATGLVKLRLSSAQQNGIEVYHPIFIDRLPHDTPTQRRETLQGFVAGIFDIQNMMMAALADVSDARVQVSLYDEAASGRDRLLYFVDLWNEASEQESNELARSKPSAKWSDSFEMAGRTWSLQFTSTDSYVFAGQSRRAWLVLFGGLLIAGFLGAFLLEVTGRTMLETERRSQLQHAEEALRVAHDELEVRVVERTAELEKMNTQLHQEVAERKRSEEELLQSKKLLADSQAIAQLGSFEWDIRENKIIWSDELYRIYGVSRETFKVTLQSFLDCVHPDDREKVKNALQEAQENKAPLQLEERIVRPDGSVRVLATQGEVILSEQGWPVKLIGTCQDITARKEAEQEITEYAAKLERTNRELETFASVASHDLQEPLRKLISFSGLLRQDIGEQLNEHAARDVEFIVDSAQRMKSLVEDILALSRAGRSEMKRELVSLDDVVDSVLNTLAGRIEEKQARIIRTKLPEIWGDSTLLTQLYLNLISNGLKFTKTSDPEVRITCEEKKGEWEFGVADNGIGIKTEYAEQIFVPFKRLHGRAEYEGTGIGLAICRKAVERHGGNIWVESEPGKGAWFKFTLQSEHRANSCTSEKEAEPSFSS